MNKLVLFFLLYECIHSSNCSLLLALQVLHIIWTVFIVKIVIQALTSPGVSTVSMLCRRFLFCQLSYCITLSKNNTGHTRIRQY